MRLNKFPGLLGGFLVALSIVPAQAAYLDLTGAQDLEECVYEHVDGVGTGCRTKAGTISVVLPDGSVFETHGPDPKEPATPDHGIVIEPGDPERDPVCATDHYQHVLYGRPASSPDRLELEKASIRSIVGRMNAVLNESSLASGGPTADFKVLCDDGGQVQVDSFSVASDGSDFDDVVQAARDAGFDAPQADYTIFFDVRHPAYCGVGSYYSDDRLDADNNNNFGGSYGITYRGCWDGRTPMHENGHNQGAVQLTAPMSDLNAHCLENGDVMCYTYSGSSYRNVICPSVINYDCRFDTYFDSAPEPDEWLSTHWNIGSRLNRFISFGPSAGIEPPTALFTAVIADRSIRVDASASSDADGSIAEYTWNWGDGSWNGAGKTACHDYQAAGTYDLTLTVRDDQGASSSQTQSVTVSGSGGSEACSSRNGEFIRTETANYVAIGGDLLFGCGPQINNGAACFDLTGVEYEARIKVADDYMTPIGGAVHFQKSRNIFSSEYFCGSEHQLLIPPTAEVMWVQVYQGWGQVTCGVGSGAGTTGTITVDYFS